jgi:conjugative transfer pilus assembly protein TraH
MHFRNRINTYLKFTAFIFIFLVTDVYASLESELNEMFYSMTTSSNPRKIETERRGVISGGSVSMRNPIRNPNIVTMTMPYARGGCSGIDLYGGSFSYINKEEFSNFLRAIASNASGYAFQIALGSMCEKCMQHIETLQKKIQNLNQYFGNSCQLAQGIVNDSLDAFGRKGLNDASLIGQFEGVGDLFELNNGSSPENIFNKAQEAAPDKITKISGNITWQALKNIQYYQNDNELLESIMSLTGSIIASDNLQKFAVLPHGLITMQTLVEGGESQVYKCDTTSDGGCLNVEVRTKTIKGFASLIKDVLSGDESSSSSSVIDKFAKNYGTFSQNELKVINSLPSGVLAKIRTLSAKNPAAARLFVNDLSVNLGFLMTVNLVDGYLTEVESAINSSNHTYQKLMLDKIKEVIADINSQKVMLSNLYGENIKIEESYKYLIEEMPITDYMY